MMLLMSSFTEVQAAFPLTVLAQQAAAYVIQVRGNVSVPRVRWATVTKLLW
jgi:energy-converting hydrogenase Eha subunit A